MIACIGSDTVSQITSNHLAKAHFNVKGYEYDIQNRGLWELYPVGIWNDHITMIISVKLYEEHMHILSVVLFFLLGNSI